MTRFEFGVCVLDIKGARPMDEGIITCKAKNSIGDAETNARLVVKRKWLALIVTHHIKRYIKGPCDKIEILTSL